MSVNDRRYIPSLATVQEVSTVLRVNERTVRRMIERRQLQAFRIGGRLRIPRDSLVHLLSSSEVRGGNG